MAGQQRARGHGGDNIIFTAPGYGYLTAIAIRLTEGISITSTQGTSRNGSAWYPMKVLDTGFTVELVFADHEEYRQFSEWMETYCRRVADPDGDVGAMRVVCPVRDFDKVGIPNQQPAATYGDAWDAVAYHLPLAFEGTRDPIDLDSGLISRFVPGTEDWEESQYFYPAGNLQAGEQPKIDLGAFAPDYGDRVQTGLRRPQ